MSKVNKLLNKIQTELKVPKTRVVKGKNKDTGQYFDMYSYRNRNDIGAKIKPILKKEGGYVIQSEKVIGVGDKAFLECETCLHLDDEKVCSTSVLGVNELSIGYGTGKKSEGQTYGEAISYLRKYNYEGLFCLEDSGVDDDSTHEERLNATNKTVKLEDLPGEELAKKLIESTEVIEGFQCSICGSKTLKSKKNTPYCPYFKVHQEKGEKGSIIPIETDEEVEFINNLPE